MILKRLCIIACTLAGLAVCGCATSGRNRGIVASAEGAGVPEDIAVRGPSLATVHATGVQIYMWDPWEGPHGGWKLKAPDATFTGDIAGTHTAGPKWTCSADGSSVTATMIGNHASPAPEGAVPWLLLRAKGHDGSGKLSDVTYIQRINTTGGRAPAANPTSAGEETRVPYTADYIFFGPGAEPAAETHR